MKHILLALALLVAAALPRAQSLDETFRFAVIGDNGTGDRAQLDIGQQMAAWRVKVPYDLVLMVRDNLYGRPTAREYADAFERPYKTLIDAGVKFVAVLGNHDAPETARYPGYNMDGRRYFSYARGHVRFFALDTNLLDAKQLEWFESSLAAAVEPWKVVYFHHPLYSIGGRHGSNVELRVTLEPVLVRHRVNVVFAGHDHLYERLKPQKGITYFVTDASGKLRHGFDASLTSAFAYDQDQSFMLIEVGRDELRFRAISRTGQVVD